MSVSWSFWSRTSYRLLDESASFLSVSSSVARRLPVAACDFCCSISARSSASRLWSWLSSAWSPAATWAARASMALRSRPTSARLRCTSGWASLYFSFRRCSSRFRLAAWVARDENVASAAICGSASRLCPERRISAICFETASTSIRRPWAAVYSSVSLVRVVVVTEPPSGTNRSWPSLLLKSFSRASRMLVWVAMSRSWSHS